MFDLNRWKYSSLATRPSLENDVSPPSECLEDFLREKSAHNKLRGASRTTCLLGLIIFLTSASIIIQLVGYQKGQIVYKKTTVAALEACKTPIVRKEWREASIPERTHYLDSVLCLMQKPSLLHPGTSRYDDIVYTHITTGQYSHYASAFLPWHRYFLHTFETTMKEECGYTGHLYYWDWSLDSDDLSSSPVWDAEFGFGGDGNSELALSTYRGRCVTDGVFANTTRAYLSTNPSWRQGITYAPHCLARGFYKGRQLQELQSNISSTAIETLLSQEDFEDFFQTFEVGSHQVIPQFVQGDFMTYTAPNDPVFFLHHTQVDRIWWMWQQKDLKTRLHSVKGASLGPSTGKHASHHKDATLGDLLPMGGLAVDRHIRDVMDAGNDLLCYSY